ncbi:Testosterone 17-beta-dehydrogenase 3 [Manis javanica]|nr:Testosterone 17-beta-dehydrogenase 3 [Manis javanica]
MIHEGRLLFLPVVHSHFSTEPTTLRHAVAYKRLHGRITRVIQADFTGDLEIYEAIEAGVKDLEMGALGMSPHLSQTAPCSPDSEPSYGRPPPHHPLRSPWDCWGDTDLSPLAP